MASKKEWCGSQGRRLTRVLVPGQATLSSDKSDGHQSQQQVKWRPPKIRASMRCWV